MGGKGARSPSSVRQSIFDDPSTSHGESEMQERIVESLALDLAQRELVETAIDTSSFVSRLDRTGSASNISGTVTVSQEGLMSIEHKTASPPETTTPTGSGHDGVPPSVAADAEAQKSLLLPRNASESRRCRFHKLLSEVPINLFR